MPIDPQAEVELLRVLPQTLMALGVLVSILFSAIGTVVAWVGARVSRGNAAKLNEVVEKTDEQHRKTNSVLDAYKAEIERRHEEIREQAVAVAVLTAQKVAAEQVAAALARQAVAEAASAAHVAELESRLAAEVARNAGAYTAALMRLAELERRLAASEPRLAAPAPPSPTGVVPVPVAPQEGDP